jgi:polysaccharide export outer membrane protein
MRVLLALIVLCSLLTGAGAQVLAPGDTISVSVYQDPKLDRQIVIGPTGMISFPLAGQIKAGGMTPETLESTIKAKLKDKYTTDLDVTVTLVASKAEAVAREPRPLEEDLKPRIYVTGEVLRPGPYVIRLRMTVLQAIAVSGGFGLYAAKKRVQVRRQILGREVMYLFDYEAFHKGRNVEDNIDLIPGDVVIVPERGLFE